MARSCYIATLSISVAALLFYQCFNLLLTQDTSIQANNVGHSCKQVNEERLHDKKYGYFLQITDTHVRFCIYMTFL